MCNGIDAKMVAWGIFSQKSQLMGWISQKIAGEPRSEITRKKLSVPDF
jgi:hypothetical protein